jgi:hypothetical protein
VLELKRERYTNDPEYRERQRKRQRERHRMRYATDPEYRERKRERQRRYRMRYASDPERRSDARSASDGSSRKMSNGGGKPGHMPALESASSGRCLPTVGRG